MRVFAQSLSLRLLAAVGLLALAIGPHASSWQLAFAGQQAPVEPQAGPFFRCKGFDWGTRRWFSVIGSINNTGQWVELSLDDVGIPAQSPSVSAELKSLFPMRIPPNSFDDGVWYLPLPATRTKGLFDEPETGNTSHGGWTGKPLDAARTDRYTGGPPNIDADQHSQLKQREVPPACGDGIVREPWRLHVSVLRCERAPQIPAEHDPLSIWEGSLPSGCEYAPLPVGVAVEDVTDDDNRFSHGLLSSNRDFDIVDPPTAGKFDIVTMVRERELALFTIPDYFGTDEGPFNEGYVPLKPITYWSGQPGELAVGQEGQYCSEVHRACWETLVIVPEANSSGVSLQTWDCDGIPEYGQVEDAATGRPQWCRPAGANVEYEVWNATSPEDVHRVTNPATGSHVHATDAAGKLTIDAPRYDAAGNPTVLLLDKVDDTGLPYGLPQDPFRFEAGTGQRPDVYNIPIPPAYDFLGTVLNCEHDPGPLDPEAVLEQAGYPAFCAEADDDITRFALTNRSDPGIVYGDETDVLGIDGQGAQVVEWAQTAGPAEWQPARAPAYVGPGSSCDYDDGNGTAHPLHDETCYFVVVRLPTGSPTVDPPPQSGLRLSPSVGASGQTVRLRLGGFTPGETVTLTWDAAGPAPTTLATATAGADGGVTVYAVVPCAPAGSYRIEAVGSTSGVVFAQDFTVAAGMSLSQPATLVGEELTATMTGYRPNETIEIRWSPDGTTWSTLATVTADATGGATATFAVPEAAKGAYSVEAVGAAGTTTISGFSIMPSWSQRPKNGPAGTEVEVDLRGFSASVPFELRWHEGSDAASPATVVATGTTSPLGSAELTFAAPEGATSFHLVDVVAADVLLSAVFYLTGPPACALTPATGAPGQQVSVACGGFQEGEQVTVHWDDPASPALATRTAPTAGDITASVTVPDAAPGQYDVVAVGGTTGRQATASFTLTPSLSLLPSSGPVGTQVSVSLRGYAPGETVTIAWDAGGVSPQTVATATADAEGRASVQFDVPAAPGGTYRIDGTGGTSGAVASADFALTARLRLATTFGPVGTSVTATLDGFAANEAVELRWDAGTAAPAVLATATTDATGAATATFAVPEAARGDHPVEAAGAGGSVASSGFSVISSVALAPTSGAVGETVAVTLRGYAAGEAVAVRWYDTALAFTVVATATASEQGSATASFVVPNANMGLHRVEGLGATSGGTASANFTITATPWSCAVSPASAAPGAFVTATCSGFAAGETVTLTWDGAGGAVLASSAASPFGTWVRTFALPDAPLGAHQVVATGGSSGRQAAAPVQVAAGLTLAPASGSVGSSLTVTLRGYAAGEAVTVRWDAGSGAPVEMATVTTGADGKATASWTVPSAPGGLHRVEGTGASSGAVAGRDFTLLTRVRLSPSFGGVGTAVTVTLDGYRPGEAVEVRWYETATTYAVLGTVTASAAGEGTFALTVPDAVKGAHKVEGAGGADSLASTTFVVNPSLALAPTVGPPGTAATVTLRGFGANEAIEVRWYDTTTAYTVLTTVTASAQGSAGVEVVVPETTAGDHKVEGAGATSLGKASMNFTVFGCRLTPGSAAPGAFVTATCSGFAAGETIAFTWGSATGPSLGSGTASASGALTKSFAVPDAPRGPHNVVATGASSGKQAVSPLTVVPAVAPSPGSGWVGSAVTITLRGYAANEAVTVRWDASTGSPVTVGTVTTNADGRATIAYTIPAAAGGTHRIDGTGQASGAVAGYDFTVWTRIRLAPTFGAVGTSVNVTLDGFKANEAVELRWYDTTTAYTVVGTATASAAGEGVASFAVPEAARGAHKVEAVGAAGSTNFTFFTVNPSLAPAPAAGPEGTTVVVTLRGYQNGETVTVRWFDTLTTSTVVGSTAASALGSGTVTFAVPAATLGGHKVEGTGGTSNAKASQTFTVEEFGGQGFAAAAAEEPGGEAAALQETDPTPNPAPTSTPVPTPVPNKETKENFSAVDPDGAPTDWTVATAGGAAVWVGWTDGNAEAVVQGGTATLVRAGRTFDPPDVRVRLRFLAPGGRAGVLLAYDGPNDYIAVVADEEADALALWEVVGGQVRVRWATEPGAVPIEPGRNLWLRTEAGYGAGGAWVTVWWSKNGKQFRSAGYAEGLTDLAGAIGLMADGAVAAAFDNVVAQQSQAAAPVAAEATPEPTATATPSPTSEPTPNETPTPESTTPGPAPAEPTATEAPTLTPEPVPTETPTPEPPPTETPVPTPTETPVPPPTEAPAAEESPAA